MQEQKKFGNWRIIGVYLIVIVVSLVTAILYTNTWSEVSLLAFPVIISFIGVGAIFLFDKKRCEMQEPKKFSIRRIVGIFLVGFGILIGGSAYYISVYSIAGWTFPVAIIFIATGGYIIGADS